MYLFSSFAYGSVGHTCSLFSTNLAVGIAQSKSAIWKRPIGFTFPPHCIRFGFLFPGVSERRGTASSVISCSSFEFAAAVRDYSLPHRASTTCSEDYRGLYTARDASPESSRPYYARMGKYAWTEVGEHGGLDHTPPLEHARPQLGEWQAQETGSGTRSEIQHSRGL